ncbi:MAG: hypothetical protein ACUVWR_14375 [Anaerolineae bacterium]
MEDERSEPTEKDARAETSEGENEEAEERREPMDEAGEKGKNPREEKKRGVLELLGDTLAYLTGRGGKVEKGLRIETGGQAEKEEGRDEEQEVEETTE